MACIDNLQLPNSDLPPRASWGLTAEEFMACLMLVKVTRVAGLHGRTGNIQWASREDMNAAFAIYNRANGKPNTRMGIGRAPCHTKVFNWILDVATESLAAERVTGGPVQVACHVAKTEE